MIRTIAILGAGHGGCAAAADLTRQGFTIRLQSRNAARLAPIREQGGLTLKGVFDGFVPIAHLTQDLGEAIEGADLIMLVVPSVAVGQYARELAPLLKPDQPILINPGHTGGGLHFTAAARAAGYRGALQTGETVTLTYICRMTGPAAVHLYSYTENLAFAGFPGRDAAALFQLLKPVYPRLALASSVLETALTNINAMFHPPGMLMNAGWIEHTHGDFLFYREGITESVGRVTAALDAERMAIAKALHLPAVSFLEAFHRAGLTTRAAMESGSIARASQESEPNRAVKSPPALQHRYVYEDVGYGLVPMAALGRLAQVPTPAMDALITLAELALGAELRESGLTLAKMGLAGKTVAELPQFLERGG